MARKPIAPPPATKKPVANSKVASKAKRGELAKISERFGAFRPAREVLCRVRAVPTRFASFDHAAGVGGLPIERFMLVHGPSNEGKTAFTLGLLESFLRRGHYGALIDAEYTTPFEWTESLMGDASASSRFFAHRPTSYEETVDAVRDFAKGVASLRKEGEIDADTSALIVVDSIRKLVPKNLLKKLAESAEKHGVDGYSGRAAQIRAAMNAAWMDELVPLLASTGTAMVVIARESEDPESHVGYKVGGGRALYYDSSLVMRIERARWVYESGSAKTKDGERNQAIGECHSVTVTKTKVAMKEDRQQVGYFHTSNGVIVPAGFDRPRDLIVLGKRVGVVEGTGGWISFCGKKFQGEMKAVRALHADVGLANEFEAECRALFEKVAPEEHTSDGVAL